MVLHCSNPYVTYSQGNGGGKRGQGKRSQVSHLAQANETTLDSDIKRVASMKYSTKTERNQNIVNAFYQGGHTQTAVAVAFDLSSSTARRAVKEYETEGSM